MLEIYELLDRFELLYPTNSKLSDLRRSYIDRDLSSIFRLTNVDENLRKAVLEKNLHSIFRIIPNMLDESIEDLRKAVTEHNLHSIFRLINDDDLRKLLLEDNTWKLWSILERYTETQFVAAFKNFFVNNITYDKDCFSRGQLQSKIWLVTELKRLDLDLGTVFLCAGWYATLAVMLFESNIKIDKIRSFDIDPSTVNIAETFNKPWFTNSWQFKALIDDILNIDYNKHTWQYWSNANNRTSKPIIDTPDTIINTSCEHIENFVEWYNKIPNEKLIILQGNDYFEIAEHVNCSKNLLEFSNKSPMKQILYEGELELPKYKRFMKIGIK
jgi:hypothetical protein